MIVQNAGAERAIVVGKVKESPKLNYGYNAQTDEYEDLVAAGVISNPSDAHSPAERRVHREAAAHDGVRRGGEEGEGEGEGEGARDGQRRWHWGGCTNTPDAVTRRRAGE